MANYIVSATNNADRQIRTNTSGLSKSIKALLDEGYESVTVLPVVEHGSFKIGQQVKVIDNTVGHQFPIGDTVIIDDVFPVTSGNGYRCSGYVNGKPDTWWLGDKDLAEI